MPKRKLSPQQKKLQADFDKMMQRHAKPLERGAVAKGAKSAAKAMSKRGRPMLERTRVPDAMSLDTGHASTALKAQPMYTGDKVLGVALMHKSSYAPVFSTEDAHDIAKMRRG